MMQDTPDINSRPLWLWILLAIEPGIGCDALGAISLLAKDMKNDDLSAAIMLPMLAAPLLGLGYLIVLGKRYVRAGMGKSVAMFVIGYGLLNGLLWGAGCAMQLSTLSFH